ncbi:MAG: Thioredoxin-1 [Pelotomaculum sp. PtaB.Bin013]|uniref:Thioredoxin n=1 Tax=Pelotomaculum isophthalicicum JI TaxID=947010 RepID=A0A9X4H5G4_9FIRM|nr:thioredoxin [Pelotomaculum isophthalicicum]MDF9409648.1 thioredoxin [Pelotomaculum isophthalicicum JI]OPX81980.1 MAG: Thioredoxin-1 [Pelotomaculum sp. PtaB.Bin013]
MASGNILALEDNNFNQVINETNVPLLVDFWAAWCGPCKMIAPVVEEVAVEFEEKIKVGKLNVDENQSVPGSLKVNSIPTLIIFKDGKEVERSVGYKTKDEIRRWLTKHL